MEGRDLEARTAAFAAAVFQADAAPSGCKPGGRQPADQLLDCPRPRSGQTTGHRPGPVRATEFIAKLGIVDEEADEAVYWLEFLLSVEPGATPAKVSGYCSPKPRSCAQSSRRPAEPRAEPSRQRDRRSDPSRSNTDRSSRSPDRSSDHQLARSDRQHHHITRSSDAETRHHLARPLRVSRSHAQRRRGPVRPVVHGQPQVPRVGSPEQGRSHSDQSRPQRSHHRCRRDGRQTGATVVGIFEIVSWLGTKGVQSDRADEQGRLDHGEGPAGYDDRGAFTAAVSTTTASSISASRPGSSSSWKTVSRSTSLATPRSSAT